jgi:flagellin
VQASNAGAVNADARGYIGEEITQLSEALGNIAARTDFNGTKLLDADKTLTFQTGANGGETVEVDLKGITAVATAIATVATNVSGAGPTGADFTSIDTQIKTVSSARASLGASQNRFESTINSLNVAVENLSASESRVRDADMAQEMVGFTRAQILSQAGTAMLAQANQASQGVLSLLR